MKFLIIGDLHGNKPKIYYKNFDAIIAPGDFCSDSARKYFFKEFKEHIKNPDTTIRWYDVIGKKKAKQVVMKSLNDGRRILKYLDSFGVPIFTVPGNWDWSHFTGDKWDFLNKDYFKTYLSKDLKNIKNLHNKVRNFKDYQFVGYGKSNSPEYPQYRDDAKRKKKNLREIKKRYDKLLKKYDKLFKRTKKPTIFLSHNVPFGTPIDKIVNKDSPKNGRHYGSLLARKMIEKHQPLVCVGGHMHEHFRKCKIGKTTCINSGFGSYVNVFMELEENKIKKLEFKYGKKGKYKL